ncbi:MAG: polyphosphate kinase 1 [Bacteroidales bacterium]|nr:polyphosphate kinase 1 [Bacteroidales bacterium]
MAKPVKMINREISWLQFNERVLQEAMDRNTPLVERLRFLGIFSNNRDEFFRVRVATLRRMIKMGATGDQEISFRPRQILKEVVNMVEEQEKKFNATFQEIKKQLEKNHIFFVDEREVNEEQGKFVKQYFHEEVHSQMFPIMLKNLDSPELLRDKFIYLAVVLHDTTNVRKDDYALLEVPTDSLSRFLLLPDEGQKRFVMMLDDVIRYSLGDMFRPLGYDEFNAYTIKITRDAELDIDSDISKSFYELMTESLKKRSKGFPVRFVYDKEIPRPLLEFLMKKLKISEEDSLRGGGRYHNFRDFMSFPNIGNHEMVYPSRKPLKHLTLSNATSLFDVIRKKDVMLHYPYQSFDYLIDLLREASIDPKVKAIKMTFYRAARDSKVINALINAARNGKYVTVFLEIQARFDEKANIYWAERLSEEGVKIIKNLPGYKVHAKLMLIRRKEHGKNVFYTNISTGNFNESTARVYADESLFTANQKIAREVDMLFHLFESPYTPPAFRHLLVAPYHLRDNMVRLLNREIRNAKKGLEAWAIIKLNNLVDKVIVQKLVSASRAGVRIQIICRGICVLVPGIEGYSENIQILGHIDRYLEHSRIFVFANAGKPEYFISSADWMMRNFDHRFEVSCPIYDPDIQKELMLMLQTQLNDNVKARYINSYPEYNEYKAAQDGEPLVRSQGDMYSYFKDLLPKT